MSKDIISQLKSLKHSPQAGWVSGDQKEKTRLRMMEAISHHETSEVVLSVKDGVAYYKWAFSNFISKPLVFGTAAFVLLLGGWMTSVNAASNSLPGDTLYSLKLATESAQLKLASVEHRAVLHTEFAQRRYEEAIAISGSPERGEFFVETLDAFQVQIGLAGSDLQLLIEQGGEGSIEVANTVDQKIGELNAVIGEEAQSTLDTEGAAQIAEARESTQVVENAVVDVIVDAHENASAEDSQKDLEELFRKELNELLSREAFNLGRLVVINDTIASNQEVLGSVELPIGESLNVLEFEISSATNRMNEALDLSAAGGHKDAFELLKDANNTLLDIERRLALVEITILNTLSDTHSQEVQEEIHSTEVPSQTEAESLEVKEETINSSDGEDG